MSKTPVVVSCVILGLALVSAAAVVSRFQLETAHKQTISVKGYAKATVASDVGIMRCRVSARHGDRVQAMRTLQDHQQSVRAYLDAAGFGKEAIAVGIASIDPVAARDENGKLTNQIEYYDASAAITVTSTDATRIAEVARGVADLASQGVLVNVYEPEFLISNPDDHKLKLIAAATANASERAKILATDGGGRVGRLKSARQGVFQITRPNSTETSSYGIYDTSTISKEIKAVVTLEYEVAE